MSFQRQVVLRRNVQRKGRRWTNCTIAVSSPAKDLFKTKLTKAHLTRYQHCVPLFDVIMHYEKLFELRAMQSFQNRTVCENPQAIPLMPEKAGDRSVDVVDSLQSDLSMCDRRLLRSSALLYVVPLSFRRQVGLRPALNQTPQECAAIKTILIVAPKSEHEM